MSTAERLREETTMTLAWIATRLQMGTWTNVSNPLRPTQRAQVVAVREEYQK